MINFILCEDNKNINKKVCDIIDKEMMKNKLAYKKHTFFDYDSSFFNIMTDGIPAKIYILDIETPSASGIDIARRIREFDIDSIIIFLTSHNELGSVLLKDELMFLTFICKFDDMEKRLISAIKNSIKMLGVRQAIRFIDHGILYTIPLNSIFYITTDTTTRKSVVVTDCNQFFVSKTFNEITSMLDDRFKQTHRACFVNMNKVIKIDKKNNTILFENNVKIDLLSDKYKRGIGV